MIESVDFVLEALKNGKTEYAVVKNPSYVYPDKEYYALAEKETHVETLSAILMDMDGTTTTTEELCIYSLEQMVRRMSGKLSPTDWKGLDHDKDYPHIIGNSTTKHVEYLIETYQNFIVDEAVKTEFVKAAWWTLNFGQDEQRKQEVVQNLKKKGIAKLTEVTKELKKEQLEDFTQKIQALNFSDYVNLGIDIYYEVYHRILSRLKSGEQAEIRKQVFGTTDTEKSLIAPMPGIPVLLPLLKGWLGDEAPELSAELMKAYKEKAGEDCPIPEAQVKEILSELSAKFSVEPVKIGLVTSSIFYEAEIVINQVMAEIKRFVEQSPLSDKIKTHILEQLGDYHNIYDAFVTATDSSEIRLKPHRDLYSIALHKAGVMPEKFNEVLGFEDSQSGTVAIRAAGIGCCIAVPFAQTSAHNLEAAVHTLKNGVPSAIVDYKLFLKQ